MRCTNCRSEIAAGKKFCTQCGAPAALACQSCGGVNAAGARYCGDCGCRLDDASIEVRRAAPLQQGGASAPTAAAERRQVNVMFCDLVGSTELASRLDPEEMRELIAAYRARVAEIVAGFEGFVAQYLGDGVLAYFGYPSAHEDDAERAVRAALAVVSGVQALKAQPDTMLQARIGIATGLVVVGEQVGAEESRERAAIGETPNLAARLQAAAAANEIVISESTRRLLGRMFDLREMARVAVKGPAEPVTAYVVLGASTIASRFDALRASELTPLVGREEEMELLLRRWEQAKRGEGRVVLFSGEPGIGKSRIADTLQKKLDTDKHVRLRYFCSPHHTHSALYPFISHLGRASSLEPRDTASACLDKLAALLGSTSADLQRDVTLFGELLTLPPDARYPPLLVTPQEKKELTLRALLAHLEVMTTRSPVLMVFEDAHWIDPTSLELLDRTIARVANLPVMLIATFRPDFQPTWVGQSHVTMHALSRLGRREGTQIMHGVTRGRPLPKELAEQILQRTDGVPLFIEELTSTVLEGGLLREEEGRLLLDGPLPALAVPTTLQASLVSRLDRLASVKGFGPDRRDHRARVLLLFTAGRCRPG